MILMSLTSIPAPLLSDESKVARLTVCRASDPLSTLVTALLIAMPSAVAEFVPSPFATIKLLAEPPVVSVSTMPFRDELIAARDARRLRIDRLHDVADRLGSGQVNRRRNSRCDS